ncbi:EAL domain-containing protein [Paenibacillus sp. GCM10012303]|uniref:EAL domain-containing protein n=1 Tax=Paenibacillus sp. GCM10012303 TaxID=3317340 RepID=UPI00360D7B91
MEQLGGQYHHGLMALSYLVAVLASYTALDLAGRITAARGPARRLWLSCGAFAMGSGIWSMHFIGMLAFHLPVPVRYDYGVVFASYLLAVLASGIALYIVSRKEMPLPGLLAGGLLMGAGVSSMHYIGMSAMQLHEIVLTYDAALWWLSVAIAITSSLGALSLSLYFRIPRSRYYVYGKWGGGFIMGAGIVGMHYTGMLAARFHAESPAVHTAADSGMSALFLACGIALVTLFVLGFVLIAAVFDKRLATAAEQLAESEHHFRSLFDYNSDAVFSMDRSGVLISVNPAVENLTGLSSSCFIGRHLTEISGVNPEQAMYHFNRTLEGVSQSYEIAYSREDGRAVDLLVHMVPLSARGRVTGAYCLARDITESKRTERRMHHLAYYDELTGLPNRRSFMDALEACLYSGRSAQESVALFCLNLDRFKSFSQTAGHKVGDQLLQSFAERLRGVTDGCDFIPARMGGDEFAYMAVLRTEGEAAKIASKMNHPDTPVVIGGLEFHLSASIGYALYPKDGTDGESLLQKAQTALDSAKRRGGNRAYAYDAAMEAAANRKLEIESGLRKAIERGELDVHYQPQVELKSGALVGAEALVRWKHPVQGYVPPSVFIPVAEETGLIKPIGEWVLRSACMQAKAWQAAGYAPITVSVNLSNRQFEEQHLPETVGAVLSECGLEPNYLELEITESMAMDVTRTIQALQGLKKLGIGIGIDDFGTGYSSLSYLKRFPIDKIKIDQSFVRDIANANDDNDTAIVSAIIAIARHLQLKVVAEGVETQEQFDYLQREQCDMLQGYYFSPPVPADRFESLLREYGSRKAAM